MTIKDALRQGGEEGVEMLKPCLNGEIDVELHSMYKRWGRVRIHEDPEELAVPCRALYAFLCRPNRPRDGWNPDVERWAFMARMRSRLGGDRWERFRQACGWSEEELAIAASVDDEQGEYYAIITDAAKDFRGVEKALKDGTLAGDEAERARVVCTHTIAGLPDAVRKGLGEIFGDRFRPRKEAEGEELASLLEELCISESEDETDDPEDSDYCPSSTVVGTTADDGGEGDSSEESLVEEEEETEDGAPAEEDSGSVVDWDRLTELASSDSEEEDDEEDDDSSSGDED